MQVDSEGKWEPKADGRVGARLEPNKMGGQYADPPQTKEELRPH